MVLKILKLNENNQYGNAMTKPLLACSIKRSKKTPALRKLNLIIEEISDEDKLGHLFIVDIKFNEEEASEKHLLFIEIYTPIVVKKKALPPKESSVFQLLDAMRLNDKGLLNSYNATSETHSTMWKKFFYPTVRQTYSLFDKKMWVGDCTNLFAVYF